MNESTIDLMRSAALKIYELPEFVALPLPAQIATMDSLKRAMMETCVRVDEE